MADAPLSNNTSHHKIWDIIDFFEKIFHWRWRKSVSSTCLWMWNWQSPVCGRPEEQIFLQKTFWLFFAGLGASLQSRCQCHETESPNQCCSVNVMRRHDSHLCLRQHYDHRHSQRDSGPVRKREDSFSVWSIFAALYASLILWLSGQRFELPIFPDQNLASSALCEKASTRYASYELEMLLDVFEGDWKIIFSITTSISLPGSRSSQGSKRNKSEHKRTVMPDCPLIDSEVPAMQQQVFHKVQKNLNFGFTYSKSIL